jgi:curved DNA-binding protein CbpA
MPSHPFVDYYEVLGVDPQASAQEVRRAFRLLVLKAHPDKNPDRSEWSERRIREILRAYDVIGDAERRRRFDVEHRARARGRSGAARPVEPFYFKRSDPKALALRILHFLLNGRGADAVALLRRLEERGGAGILREVLDRGDYLDCLFLLGEHHLRRREYLEALAPFREFHAQERGRRQPRHYLGSVVDHLKELYLRWIPRILPPEEALAHLRDAARLDLGRGERGRLERLVASLESRTGRGDARGGSAGTGIPGERRREDGRKAQGHRG